MVDIIGFAAAALTTLSFVPQVWKAWTSRDTGSLSLLMLSALLMGLVLWLIFGLMTKSAPIIAANSVSIGLIGTVLVLKIKYG